MPLKGRLKSEELTSEEEIRNCEFSSESDYRVAVFANLQKKMLNIRKGDGSKKLKRYVLT